MYKLPICSAILFNHESSLRTEKFVFKKIVDYLDKIKKNKNKNKKLHLGNIEVKRDWGWAPDYMKACYKILNTKKIDDYIIATGKTTSLKNLVYLCFKHYNLDWKKYVIINKKNFRNFETKENYANIKKIKKNIKWSPAYTYKEVIKKLINKNL